PRRRPPGWRPAEGPEGSCWSFGLFLLCERDFSTRSFGVLNGLGVPCRGRKLPKLAPDRPPGAREPQEGRKPDDQPNPLHRKKNNLQIIGISGSEGYQFPAQPGGGGPAQCHRDRP